MKPLIVAVMALLFFACQRYESNKDEKAAGELQALDNQADLVKKDTSLSKLTATPVVTTEPDRKIIKTANLQMELKNFDAFNRNIHQSLTGFGAYIANEQQIQNEKEISNNITIKVPVDQFDALMNYLSFNDKDAKLLEKQITTEDVSTQVVDARSRIASKQQLRDKYAELMGNSKKMDEVIRVQNEISAVTEDIEAAASKVKYLSRQSAYSTINLKYFQVLNGGATNDTDDTAPSFGKDLSLAFRNGFSYIGNLLVFLVNIWPIILLGALAWYFVRRKIQHPGAGLPGNVPNDAVSDTTEA